MSHPSDAWAGDVAALERQDMSFGDDIDNILSDSSVLRERVRRLQSSTLSSFHREDRQHDRDLEDIPQTLEEQWSMQRRQAETDRQTREMNPPPEPLLDGFDSPDPRGGGDGRFLPNSPVSTANAAAAADAAAAAAMEEAAAMEAAAARGRRRSGGKGPARRSRQEQGGHAQGRGRRGRGGKRGGRARGGRGGSRGSGERRGRGGGGDGNGAGSSVGGGAGSSVGGGGGGGTGGVSESPAPSPGAARRRRPRTGPAGRRRSSAPAREEGDLGDTALAPPPEFDRNLKQRQQRAYDDRNASRTQLFVIMDAEQRREAQRRAALENMGGNAKERAVLARVFEKERKVASAITLSLIKDYSPRPATGQRKQENEAQGQRPRTTPNMGSSHGRAGSRSGPSTPSFPSSPLVRPSLAAHSLKIGVVVGGDKWLVKAALETPGSDDGGLLPAGFAESNFGMSGREGRRAPSRCVVVIQRAGLTGDAHRQRCTVPAREVCVRDRHGDIVLDERRVRSFAVRMAADAADAADATMDRSGRPPVSPA